jgi:tRNA-dihydrouridine synthase 3
MFHFTIYLLPRSSFFCASSRYLTGDPFVTQRDVPDDDAAEGGTSHLSMKRGVDEPATTDIVEPLLAQSRQEPGESEEPEVGDEPAAKKQRLPASERRRLAKEKRKEQKGANKGRKFARVQDDVALCYGASRGEDCADGEQWVIRIDWGSWHALIGLLGAWVRCRFSHDIPHYLSTKAADLTFPPSESLLTVEPFVTLPEPSPLSETHLTLNKVSRCPNFACSGKCQSGFKCRFLGSHVEVQESEEGAAFKLVKDEEKYERVKNNVLELNFPSSGLQKQLRQHKVGAGT